MRLILQRYPTNVIKMVFLTGILSGLRVLPSYLLVYATNAIFKFDVKAFLFWDGFILFLWLVFILFNYFIATYQEKSIQQISTSLRLSEAKKITQLSPNQFKTITAEGYISKLSNDINQIELQGLTSLYGIIANLWLIFFSTLALCLLNLWLAVAVLILSGLVLYLPNRFEKQLVFIGKKLSTSNSRFMKETTNILKGYNVLRYSNILKIIPEKISIFSNNLAEDKVEIAKVKNKVTSFLVFSSLVSQVLVDILTGYLVIIGQTTLGAISSSGNLAANIFNSISLTGQQFVQLKSANPVVADFFEEVEPAKEKKLLPDFNTVKLEQVTFGYKEDKPILKDINLVIEKGKKYLLIGESGGGKSTLLKLISGELTNYRGKILLDGKELQDVDTSAFLQYIDQNTYLFNATYEENITLWQDHPSAALEKAMKRAAIDFITEPSDLITDNGENVSGGQKQRISLARAFIQEKNFILMDEGTSSLDRSNALIIENLLLSDPNLTVIIVSHHPFPENQDKFDQIITIERWQDQLKHEMTNGDPKPQSN
ncbi:MULTISPECIES: ATP-binding cassette domain-containing protein [Enterococcus]|uniref:ABC transporter ATP-binding protein n=2 Tax=Enterococcus durans TaxID=53345 RepID=A0A367CIM8_9ENTE|nr:MULTISPECIES: ABC transporter ATP-binding protein [Enterococcus]MDB1678330.1 ABC transporter ATP-binding protein [Enterococcus durans]RCA11870.1 hypothetical protein EA71_00074 [Enterococcus durans]